MTARKLSCLECGQVNRVPSERFAENPKCGTCGAALFAPKPRAIDGQILAKAARVDEVPLIVDFWAPWCGPCRQMAPEFEKAARLLGTGARLVKLNTEVNQAAGAKWQIRSIPTLIAFRAGREVSRQSGARAAADIVRFAQGVKG